MRKTLFSMCALALSITTSAQITETPAGKLIDNMYRSSESWIQKSWTGTARGRYEGLVSKIVVGDDNCLYIYNPLSGLDSNTWLKLEKVSEGKYKAVLPQAIHKDDNGDDDDDESGSTERTLYLNRLQTIGKKKYEVVPKDKNFMEYSWDGKTLKMLGAESDGVILGMTYNNKWEERYGDWSVTIQSFDNSLITPPTTAIRKQYTLTSKEMTSPRIVEAAVNGNELYVKGIFKSQKIADKWLKLTKEGDKYVMMTNQYLGTTVKTDFKSYSFDKAEYHTFAAALSNANTIADKLEFKLDAGKGTLTTDGILRVVQGKSRATNIPNDELESYEALTLKPYEQKAGKPATPKLEYCSASDGYDYSSRTTTLVFDVTNADIDGNYLDASKMYYNVYLDDSTEPFTFKKKEYKYLDEDMTNIPFSFKDKWGYDFKSNDNQRILHFYGAKIKKVSVVMVYEDNGTKYSSDPMTTSVVTAGIENATIKNNQAEKYYTIEGCQIEHMQKGLNIVRYSDGTTKKVIIK